VTVNEVGYAKYFLYHWNAIAHPCIFYGTGLI
jgi:hypothetical protein